MKSKAFFLITISKILFILELFKMASFQVHLILDFSQEKDFPKSNLLLRCDGTLEELLTGGARCLWCCSEAELSG
jgi:hypothetical protein